MRHRFTISILPLIFLACSCSPDRREEAATSSEKSGNGSKITERNIGYFGQSDIIKNRIRFLDTTQIVIDSANKAFEAYKKTVPSILIDGEKMYIVQGDELLTDSSLYDHWLTFRYSKLAKLKEITLQLDRLDNKYIIIANDKSGDPLLWTPGTTLKFCIDKKSFTQNDGETKYKLVRDNFVAATKDWQGLCKINFSYLSQLDNSKPANGIPPGVDFMVSYTDLLEIDSPKLVASAFYKNQVKPKILRVYPKYFTTKLFDGVGIFRHEIGHIMGFRHEHISRDAPADCPDESLANTTTQGKYDFNSVMHYPCGKFNNYQQVFSKNDTSTIRSKY